LTFKGNVTKADSVSKANSHSRVAAGLRIEVEPNTTVSGLLDECELRVRILVLAGNRVVRISGPP
jgi:sulfur carrier protein ThiS